MILKCSQLVALALRVGHQAGVMTSDHSERQNVASKRQRYSIAANKFRFLFG